jgi:NitT/TauT family transport system substrate-binding protein
MQKETTPVACHREAFEKGCDDPIRYNRVGLLRFARNDTNAICYDKRSFATLRMTTLVSILVMLLSSCSKIERPANAPLRLGYLLNMTHAVPIVGIEEKIFSNIESHFFTAGGHLLNGILTDNIDIGYIGPGPYLNARHKNIDLVLLSVSAIGGNTIVLDQEPRPLKKLAVPQLGNTQDLLAKILFAPRIDLFQNSQEQGLRVRKIRSLLNVNENFEDERNAAIGSLGKGLDFVPVNPAELETALHINAVEAALVAEPWGTVLESKGYKVIDDLGSINDFPTTILVVRKEFYDSHKQQIDQFLKEEQTTLDFIKSNPDKALLDIQQHLKTNAKKELKIDFLKKSFNRVKFKNELDRNKLQELVDIAREVKYFRHEVSF